MSQPSLNRPNRRNRPARSHLQLLAVTLLAAGCSGAPRSPTLPPPEFEPPVLEPWAPEGQGAAPVTPPVVEPETVPQPDGTGGASATDGGLESASAAVGTGDAPATDGGLGGAATTPKPSAGGK